MSEQEDRGDGQDDEADTTSVPLSKANSAPTSGQGSQMQLINISACEFGEFKKYMISQYGEMQFMQGYEIIRQNRNVLYEDNGEQKLG